MADGQSLGWRVARCLRCATTCQSRGDVRELVRDASPLINHYNQRFGLNLTAAQKADLVEFLKSL